MPIWTLTKPSREGTYWMKTEGDEPSLVKLKRLSIPLLPRREPVSLFTSGLFVITDQGEATPVEGMDNVWWWGPLEAPKK